MKNDDLSVYGVGILVIIVLVVLFSWLIILIGIPLLICWFFWNKKKKKEQKLLLESMNNSFVILDIETTGLNYYRDEIVELSAIKIKNNEIIDTFSTLINPKGKITEGASKVNGITDEMVSNAPRIKEVLPDFINFVKDNVVVGYNIDFDLTFISRDCKLMGIDFEPNYIDVLDYAKRYLKLNQFRLIDVADYFNLSATQTHRALDDCKLLFECYKKIDTSKVEIRKYNLLIDVKDVFIKEDVTKIKSSKKEIDTNNPLYCQNCVITGEFHGLERADVVQILADLGAICQQNVTKKTNCLICGNIETGKTKIEKAKEYIQNGQDIKIIKEDEFNKIAGFKS